MRRTAFSGLDRRRLGTLLLVFFLALALPAAVLVKEAYGQLKWEAFHQHRQQAEELARRIDTRVSALVDAEERRSFVEYGFLVVLGDAQSNYVQRSPLAEYPPRDPTPGVVGHFQIDADGRLSTPLLPDPAAQIEDLGISESDRARRAEVEARIATILGENRLVRADARRQVARARVPASRDAPAATSPGKAEPSAVPARGGVASAAASLDAENAPAPAPSHAPEDAVSLADEASPAAMEPAPLTLREADSARGAVSLEDLDDAPASRQGVRAQAAFDRLASAGLERDLQSDSSRSERRADAKEAEGGRTASPELELEYAADPVGALKSLVLPPSAAPETPRRKSRKERGATLELYEEQALAPPAERESTVEQKTSAATRPRITTFETELDPFEFATLASGHLVLFRKVWRDGQRYIQGLLIERAPFVSALVEQPFRTTGLSLTAALSVRDAGETIARFDAARTTRSLSSTGEFAGALLYHTRLPAPLSSLELVFSAARLPAGPGARVVMWAGAALAVVLCGGFWLAYRLGVRQIDLAHQQQDFVSAVSHELKTPLTSIRMYGELLREGWASEERRKTYYDYIVEESERLSRLIGNVLQLARMTRSEITPDVDAVGIAELLDGVRSKVSTQVERAGFTLDVSCPPEHADTRLAVDTDLLSQIVINLVDNALKFSAQAERRHVEVRCRALDDGFAEIAVRDHGPGIARDQMKKVFALFYRSENELTRETVGTGIGLALVHQLARSMGGRVDVVNAHPGAEFRVYLPLAETERT